MPAWPPPAASRSTRRWVVAGIAGGVAVIAVVAVGVSAVIFSLFMRGPASTPGNELAATPETTGPISAMTVPVLVVPTTPEALVSNVATFVYDHRR